VRSTVSPARSIAVAGLALVLALTGAMPAAAAVGEWGSPVTVSVSGADAYNPQLVTDGTTITATWVRIDGGVYRVQAASSTDDGATWSTPVTLSDPGESASRPQLATDGTTITAIWERYIGSYLPIQTASSTDGGTTWSTPVTLSDAGQEAYNPQLVTDGTTITATWSRIDGIYFRIQTASSTDGGTTWSAPVTLSDAGQSAERPQLVTDGTTITITWLRYDGSHYRIQAASSADGGITWSTPVDLSASGGNSYEPQLVTDGTTITVIWYRYDASSVGRVQTASSTDGGTTWSTPTTVSDPVENAFEVQLATDGTTITAVWFRSDGSNDRIQTASSTDDGTTWSTPTTLSDAGQDAASPQLVTDGTTITVTWRGSDGISDRVQVASSADGGITWSTTTTLSDAGQDTFDLHLVTDGTTTTALWRRSDGSSTVVQSSSLVNPTEGPSGPDNAGPELADTGAHESIALGLLAGGLLLSGAVLVASRSRPVQTARYPS